MKTIRRYTALIGELLFDFFAAITGLYYSKKYAEIVKRLGLRQRSSGKMACPGIIIIQIDGLAHEHLLQAMERGCLPHIKRMLNRGDLALSRWRCGLPSTTPAVQAGIMFGNNDNIPAFRWYDKLHGSSVVCKAPSVAALLQARISRGKTGILKDGSSYVNIYDGGASRSLGTLSTMEPRRLFESARGIGMLVLFLLNPYRTLHIIYLAIKEYVTDSLQRLSLRLKGQSYLPMLGIFPLLRVFSNVITREIETFAILVDVYRGVPAIYATYYGYDEIAHHFGVHSLPARQALHSIDGCIGQIDRLRRANLTRPHALVLLGDHGLTPSEPFAARYGQSLGQYIADHLGQHVPFQEETDSERQYFFYTHLLLDELKAIEKNLVLPAARVARRIRLLVQRRLAVSNRRLPEWDVERQNDVVVKNSGSLSHVYFDIARHRMDLSEVSAAFPGLVINLLAHEGIWLIAAREGAQCLIMGQDGIVTIHEDGARHVEGSNPLQRLPEPWLAVEQLCRIASFQQSGDLVLLGAYDPEEDIVVCFERQRSSHGGLGGAQDYPFVIYPRHLNWDLSRVRNSCELYPLFAALRGIRLGEEHRESRKPCEHDA